MPQGGLDEDEDPGGGAFRELYEETSIEQRRLIREAPGWLTYDLPPELVGMSWNGRYRGQKQKWFALRFDGEESEIDVLQPGGGKYKPEFSSWRWEQLARLPDLVVPFKREVYREVVAAFRDIAAVTSPAQLTARRMPVSWHDARDARPDDNSRRRNSVASRRSSSAGLVGRLPRAVAVGRIAIAAAPAGSVGRACSGWRLVVIGSSCRPPP